MTDRKELVEMAEDSLTTAYMMGYHQRKAEIQRLRKIIEEAPHGRQCASYTYNGGLNSLMCTCWKATVLQPAKDRTDKQPLTVRCPDDIEWCADCEHVDTCEKEEADA